MTDLTKIPVTVITGFLGAGKTTLIRHLIQNPQGKRLAILVNEFGTVGVDGDILKSCADENCPVENIVELANGCICCTVADDFIPTIEQLMAMPQRPDHILIETSGLALPKPLLKAFDWPALRQIKCFTLRNAFHNVKQDDIAEFLNRCEMGERAADIASTDQCNLLTSHCRVLP